jgi:hypothetical protein
MVTAPWVDPNRPDEPTEATASQAIRDFTAVLRSKK